MEGEFVIIKRRKDVMDQYRKAVERMEKVKAKNIDDFAEKDFKGFQMLVEAHCHLFGDASVTPELKRKAGLKKIKDVI